MELSFMDIFRAFADDELSDDDLDRLFSELLQKEPPPELIEKILNTVWQLPLSQSLQLELVEVGTWGEQGGENEELLMHHEHLQPS